MPIPAVLLLLPAPTCLRPALAVFGRSIARARDLPGVIETSSLLEADFAERKRMGQLVDDRAVVEVVLEKMMDDKYMCVAASLPPPVRVCGRLWVRGERAVRMDASPSFTL
jgi:hypothetical protein